MDYGRTPCNGWQPMCTVLAMDLQQRVTDSVRALAGWRRETNHDVARVLGMSKSSANGKMIGRIGWSADDIKKLCDHYGVTFEQLTAGPSGWLGIKSSSNELTPPYVYANAA